MNALVQVWASLFDIGPYDSELSLDIDRAKMEWRGEDRIWLSPDAKEVTRWSTDPLIRECLVPSQHFNRIDIYNIDEGRRVYPSFSSSKKLRRGIPEGLHRDWIRAHPAYCNGSKSETFTFPSVVDGKIVYRKLRFRVEPGPFIPAVGVDMKQGVVTAVWPPKQSGAARVMSPAVESRSRYGPLKHETSESEAEETESVAIGKDASTRALHVSLRWPKPYDLMFPTGGGVDLLFHQSRIHACIRDWGRGNKDTVMRQAEQWVNRLSDETEVALERIWYLPKIAVDVKAARYEVFQNYHSVVNQVEDLEKPETLEELMKKRVRARRVVGWLGYFWWRLHEDLKADLNVRVCEQCESIISGGHRDRRFCTRQENPVCFQQRNRSSQRKSRGRRQHTKSGE